MDQNQNLTEINDIVEVEAFVVAMVKAGIEANKDGVWNKNDIILLGAPLLLLTPALDNLSDIWKNEVKVLDKHIDALTAKVIADLNLDPASDVKGYIEDAIGVLKHAYGLLKRSGVVKFQDGTPPSA